MCRTIIYSISFVLLLGLILTSTASADLQLFDDFETGTKDDSQTSGVLGGFRDCESNNTGNAALESGAQGNPTQSYRIEGNSSGDERGFTVTGVNNPIEEGELGLLFFRFVNRADGRKGYTWFGMTSLDMTAAGDNALNSSNENHADQIVSAGFLAARESTTGADPIQVVRIHDLDVADPTLDPAEILFELTPGTWYDCWIEADNAADTFSLYIQESTNLGQGTLPAKPTSDPILVDEPFNIPGTDALHGFICMSPADPSQGGATARPWTDRSIRIYVDDLYWDGDQGLGTPTKARNPSPADGQTDVPRDVVLSWTPGPSAATHNVYFGTSFDNVSSGIGGVTQSVISYAPAQRLDFATTYYWRVDEVNAPPDSTVYPGGVWSFTTEPVAYPIENITATASSSDTAKGPENTVNGSGLDATGVLHTKTDDDNMWLSSNEPNGTWIEYEFDGIYKLYEMWVWNYNGAGLNVAYGLNNVTIKYSTDGTNYTTLGTTHEFLRAPGANDYAHNTTVDFGGMVAKYVKITANSNWSNGMTDQYGLSEVRFFSIPILAREPSPESGTTDVSIGTIDETIDVTLGFRAGREAAEHHLYLSSDEQAVIDGNVPVTVTETSYGPLPLDLGTTYYWRVDEVNDAETPTTWQGDIWDFRTQEYFVVDDFEDYNDYEPDEIWRTWVDGYDISTNGSTSGYPDPIDYLAGEHYMETTIVHGGKQAMPFFYDNIGAAAYSEAERTFAVPQDWTKAGIQTLVLHFLGDPNNAVEQMYAKLNGSKVVYNGDAADITQAWWHQWKIDLALFGVDLLQNVTKLGIGFGDEAGTTSGASGKVFFDNVRLYRSVIGPPVGIWIEAEAADGITSPMEIYDDYRASGGKYIGADESVGDSSDAPPAPAGTASYTFTVAGGTYKISCCINIPGGSNSFWVRIQGAAIPIETELDPSGWVRWNGLPDVANWYWHDVFSDDDNENATVLFTLSAGTHTLEIGYREDGAMLDAIVISKID